MLSKRCLVVVMVVCVGWAEGGGEAKRRQPRELFYTNPLGFHPAGVGELTECSYGNPCDFKLTDSVFHQDVLIRPSLEQVINQNELQGFTNELLYGPPFRKGYEVHEESDDVEENERMRQALPILPRPPPRTTPRPPQEPPLQDPPRTFFKPVEKILPVAVPQPYGVPVLQPYPVTVPHAVPVHVPVPVPVVKTVTVQVEKKVPLPVVKHVPYNIVKTVHVPVPQPYALPVPVYKTKYILHSKTEHPHLS